MADVFLSYSHHGEGDTQAASLLSRVFAARGWSVFWDHRIKVGARWDETLERELDHARAVVVLWSRNSRDRDWVREEAAVAYERGVLVAARLEPVKPPLGLALIQAADLSDWEGEPDHPGLVALLEAVAEVMRTGTAPRVLRATGLLGFGRRREFVIVAAQTITAGALPFVAHALRVAPVSEASAAWVPLILALLIASFIVLGAAVTTRWMSVRWRVLSSVGVGVLAGVIAVPTVFHYAKAWQTATVQIPVRYGDDMRLERRVKGTELTAVAREILKRNPEWKGDDSKLIANGPIEMMWTPASIRSQWWELTTVFVATMAVVVLAFVGLTQALRIPLWRAVYAVRAETS